jgi:hypothetical protein
LCANLPLTYPLIQRVFHLKNWSAQAYSADGEYREDSEQAPSSRNIWSGTKPRPAQRNLDAGVRCPESLEVADHGIERQEHQDPQFITSVIDMEDARYPVGSSSGTSGGERSGTEERKSIDHHPV